MLKHQGVIDSMTLEEKIAFCSGDGFWMTKAMPRYAIPPVRMSDGPHGLRKQLSDQIEIGLYRSAPATCFPAACMCACSFDTALMEAVGEAVAAEAGFQQVQWVLGPGINLKRNPLCGRNFEYFSEDPFLSGELAAHWIMGLQRRGVGASLKHFVCNNQETHRMVVNSILDERALHELYLSGFEHAIRKSNPWSVMCAYNRIAGDFASDHIELLRRILRNSWGYEGVVVSDWGSVNDRIKGFEAGLDLEMPGSNGFFDASVIHAVKSGKLKSDRIDESVDRLLTLVERLTGGGAPAGAAEEDEITAECYKTHHELAKRAALESAVLLKNEDHVLPLNLDEKNPIALIGPFAQTPRFQGVGSSRIKPWKTVSLMDAIHDQALEHCFNYAQGFKLSGFEDPELLAEAVRLARRSKHVVVMVGLTEDQEAEGFDREDLKLPDHQTRLIEQIAEIHPNLIVLAVGGAPFEMPWLGQIKGLLHLHLAGQAGGAAALDLIAGRAVPCGKLAETYPKCYDDVPSAELFGKDGKMSVYAEGLYVGYRYYDKTGVSVNFPFGHGLSYTTFDYANLTMDPGNAGSEETVTVRLTVTNTGRRPGAEIVQFYVHPPNSGLYQPKKILAGFSKCWLQPGESREVSCTLWSRAFEIFDTSRKKFVKIGGSYLVSAAASSVDQREITKVYLSGGHYPNEVSGLEAPLWYRQPEGKPDKASFEVLTGSKLPKESVPEIGRFTTLNSLEELNCSWIIRRVIKSIEVMLQAETGQLEENQTAFRLIRQSALQIPLARLVLMRPKDMPYWRAQMLVAIANRHYWKALVCFTKRGMSPDPRGS
jgi:beta-glucosidase